MGLKESFRKALIGSVPNPEQKSLGKLLGLDYPQYSDGTFYSFYKNGFEKNPIVFAAIMKIASTFASVPLAAYDKDGGIIPNHPTSILFNSKPNPWMSSSTMWNLGIVMAYLTGEMRFEKTRNRVGKVIEIAPIQSDLLKVNPDPNTFIAGYTYQANGNEYPIATENILNGIIFPDPDNFYRGMSPLRAAWRAVNIDNEATDMVKILMQNMGIPACYITTTNEVTEPLLTRLKEKWIQATTGHNRGKTPAFLQTGMDVKKLSLDLNELAMIELTAVQETRICAALGVPPILIGAKAGLDKGTYANYGEARDSFWSETICPLHTMVADAIMLDADLSEGASSFSFDYSKTPQMQKSQTERQTRSVSNVTAGLMSVNEGRAMIGLDAIAGGDIFLRPLSTIAVSANDLDESGGRDDEEPKHRPASEWKAVSFKAKSSSNRDLRNVQIALGRNAGAGVHYDKIKSDFRKSVNHQAVDVMDAFESSTKSKRIGETKDVPKKLTDAERRQILEQVEADAITWTLQTERIMKPVFSSLLMKSAEAAAQDVSADFSLSSARVQRFIESYTFKFAEGITATSKEDVRAIIQNGFESERTVVQIRNDLQEKFSSWSDARAKNVAQTETIRGANAGALEQYKASGIEKLSWLASADACPICEELAAQGIKDVGHAFTQNDYDGNVEAPPGHPGCRCSLVPEVEL